MKQKAVILSVLSLLCCMSCSHGNRAERADDSLFYVTDYGAVSDTAILSTEGIQLAINACEQRGGGKVVFPAGDYKTGTIILKNNVILYLEAGATLYGSRSLDDYIPMKPEYSSLRTQTETVQLIYAESIHGAGISGFGTIDGQGSGFEKKSWNDEGITRPHLIRFITSQDITIEGVTLKNSPCWMQHYLACDRLNIHDLRIFNRNNYNNDALDLDGCHNVVVSNLICDSDDDGITLKSTSPRSCENISISNCVVSSRCNGIKLGTETNGGFKNIHISDCVVKPSEITEPAFFGREGGISGISLEITDGGIMDGVTVSDILIRGTECPLFVYLGHRARTYQPDVTIDKVGEVRHITLSDIHAYGAGKTGCSITGLPGHKVEDVVLNNISIEFAGGGTLEDAASKPEELAEEYPESTMFGTLPAYGFYIRHAKGVEMNNVRLTTQSPDARPMFVREDVE